MNYITSCAWKFQWAESWNEITAPSYLEAWERLYSGQHPLVPRSPFQHPSVVLAWAKSTYGLERLQPRFLTARSDRGDTIFLPLACVRTGFKQGYVKRLQPVGARYFDYHDPILCSTHDDLPDIAAFWIAFDAEVSPRAGTWFDTLDLTRLRIPWSLPDRHGWILADKAPCLNLRNYSDLDALLASRSKSLRGDLRRQMRRAEQEGRLSYKTHLDVSFEEVRKWNARLEADRLNRYPGSALPAHYLDALLLEATSPNGPAYFSALYFDDAPVSWHAGFADQGVMYWYVPAFDPKHSGLSPGKLHLMLAIEDALARGFDTFDFLRGMETYKAGWTDGEVSRLYGRMRISQHPLSAVRHTAARGLNKFGYLKALLKGF